MLSIKNSPQSLGAGYPSVTGRLKRVIGAAEAKPKKVALLGDSTLDNGYWVERRKSYIKKTHTVTHQTALALANHSESSSYDIGNFAVDGATTADLLCYCPLNKVLPVDPDHPSDLVHQLNEVAQWGPEIAVLSVGGNNYREALLRTLMRQLNYLQLFLRITPKQAKAKIKMAFQQVKETLVEEYKSIIDNIVERNPNLCRIVLLSQYYPSITVFTPYFIYTGFSHVARSEGKGQDPFTVVEETMNELYRELMKYVATKDKEIVFADVTSSLNPLGGNHTLQIEPNENGSIIMGQIIASAIEYNFPISAHKNVALLRLTTDTVGWGLVQQQVQSQLLDDTQINNFRVKKIEHFIRENRYRHLGSLFSPSSTLGFRFECAYHSLMGKQFDSEYRGLFAFGLLDLSLITIIASYLWRAAVNQNHPLFFRVITGIISAPILLSKMILGLWLMQFLILPVYMYHKLVHYLIKIHVQ
jgi:GDSL-like Lipase/Acylhydrolase family